ncbi:MAG: hypothetical protein AB9921_08755 [Erysipelotrichaceae bacterium]
MNKHTILAIFGYLAILFGIILVLGNYAYFYIFFFFFGVLSLAISEVLKGQKEILDYIHAQNNPSLELTPEERQRLKDKIVTVNASSLQSTDPLKTR